MTSVVLRESSRVELGMVLAGMPREDMEKFMFCAEATRDYWIGMKDDELVCVWGLIPPTLLSSRAYLWLYTTPALEGNEFVFVRHSQRAVQEMLRQYPIIRGHATIGAERSLRWLRWLGARFFEPDKGLLPFEIRKRHG